MGAQEEVVKRGREEVRGQLKEKKRKVGPELGGDGSSRRQINDDQEGRGQGAERESEGDGKKRSRTAGATSARSKDRGVAATSQRSVTSDQGVSSTSQGGGRRTEASEIQMEMEIDMKLKDGRCATTKYRVGCLTTMQSVVKRVGKLTVNLFLVLVTVGDQNMNKKYLTKLQVAAKMEQEVHKVSLKTPSRGCFLLVSTFGLLESRTWISLPHTCSGDVVQGSHPGARSKPCSELWGVQAYRSSAWDGAIVPQIIW